MVRTTRGDKEVGATEIGKLRVPIPEDLEGAMPTLVIWGWLPTPNPVGVEELIVVVMVQVLWSLGSVAGTVNLPFQVRTRSVPTATTVSSEAVAMRG